MIAPPDIPSPKQTRTRSGWDSFFPYYAGYPAKFAGAVLADAHLPSGAVVLDPWNGTGTTTLAASRLGLQSIGCDLNPVMTVIARARAVHPDDADSIAPLTTKIIASSTRLKLDMDTSDPLLIWFEPATAQILRAIETGVRRHLVSDRVSSDTTTLGNISGLAAAFYVALFAVARRLVVPFQTTNPTWLRRRRQSEELIGVASKMVVQDFRSTLAQMAAQLEVARDLPGLAESSQWGHIDLRVADSAGAELGAKVADFVLTSPPYCTRIDYTAATRIELALLSPLLRLDTGDLSRQMIGSTRVPLSDIARKSEWGATCNSFLDAVERHPSKASGGYYLKTHLDYFDKLYRSLEHLAAALKPSSKAVLVVQDSYYKEVHNDLAKVVVEMGERLGLARTRSRSFTPRTSIAHLNRFVRATRGGASPTETVLYFGN